MITIPRNDIKKLTIVAYDPIMRVLFAEPEKQALPRQDCLKLPMASSLTTHPDTTIMDTDLTLASLASGRTVSIGAE